MPFFSSSPRLYLYNETNKVEWAKWTNNCLCTTHTTYTKCKEGNDTRRECKSNINAFLTFFCVKPTHKHTHTQAKVHPCYFEHTRIKKGFWNKESQKFCEETCCCLLVRTAGGAWYNHVRVCVVVCRIPILFPLREQWHIHTHVGSGWYINKEFQFCETFLWLSYT